MTRFAFVTAVLALCASSAFAANELSNRLAPGFALPDLEFKTHDLADYRGKVVVVTIMRTTCPHCTEFNKVLNEAEKKYGGQLKVIGIVNPPDNQQSVKRYLLANGLQTTLLFDCGQMAASYLKVTPQNPTIEVPHFFVIDQKGMIREDYGYNMLSKPVFEGTAIYKILDKYVSKPVQAD
ncbi:MAG: TlpA disulfide reductase family protein [Bryobacterales bacterium]